MKKSSLFSLAIIFATIHTTLFFNNSLCMQHCPILMHDVHRADIIQLPCCNQNICQACMNSSYGRTPTCPFCRTPLQKNGRIYTCSGEPSRVNRAHRREQRHTHRREQINRDAAFARRLQRQEVGMIDIFDILEMPLGVFTPNTNNRRNTHSSRARIRRRIRRTRTRRSTRNRQANNSQRTRRNENTMDKIYDFLENRIAKTSLFGATAYLVPLLIGKLAISVPLPLTLLITVTAAWKISRSKTLVNLSKGTVKLPAKILFGA